VISARLDSWARFLDHRHIPFYKGKFTLCRVARICHRKNDSHARRQGAACPVIPSLPLPRLYFFPPTLNIMASRPTTLRPSPPLSRDQNSSHSAPLAQGKLQEGIRGGHGAGTSPHSHLPPRRAPQPQLRHIDPFLEKCIEKFIQGSTYGRGVKPVLKGAYNPGQRGGSCYTADQLPPKVIFSGSKGSA